MVVITERHFDPDSIRARRQAAGLLDKRIKVFFVDEDGQGQRDWGNAKPYRFCGEVVDVVDWATGHPYLLVRQAENTINLDETHALRVVRLDRIVNVEILCSEGNHRNNDNPGRPMCKTCEEWLVTVEATRARIDALIDAL